MLPEKIDMKSIMSEVMFTAAVLTDLHTVVFKLWEKSGRSSVLGMEEKMKKLTSSYLSIYSDLIEAKKRRGGKEESLKLWLERLSYETEDVLEEWITAQRRKAHTSSPTSTTYKKVCSFVTLPCLGLKRDVLRRGDIARKIKEFHARVDVIANEIDRYKFYKLKSRSDDDDIVSEIMGRDLDMNAVLDELLLLSSENNNNNNNNQEKKEELNIISIVGIGGIGKTTLARAVYNSPTVTQHFDTKLWVCVSESFDEVRIAKAILEDIEGSAPNLFELETVARKIRQSLQGKRYLMVLDDIWTDNCRNWEQLFNSLSTGAAGSTILVTTRNESAAKLMGSKYELHMGELSNQDSWALFSKIAFSGRTREECEELEDIGKKIAEKCRGLPLTLKIIASLMRFKSTLKDWQDVLSSEFWELDVGGAKGLFPPLMLSYYYLPSVLKQCFSFCSFFPKNHLIEANILIKLWMAQGYLSSIENVEMEEVLGQEYLQNLAMRSFFQVVEKTKDGKKILSIKMHDMLHDFAQYLTKNEFSIIQVHNDLEPRMKSSHKRNCPLLQQLYHKETGEDWSKILLRDIKAFNILA